MRAGIATGFALAAALVLAGCGEKAQTSPTGRKADDSPVAGANPAYNAPGWKVGDAASWDQHMRARTQKQNEYGRMESAPQ